MRFKPLYFNTKEYRQMLNTGLMIGVISTLFMWRFVSMNLFTWIGNFVGLTLIALASVLVFVSFGKIYGYRMACYVRYVRWKAGQIAGLIICIFSTGALPVLLSGTLDLKANMRVRHGKIFPHENPGDILYISFGALLGLVAFGGILTLFGGQFFAWAKQIPLIMSLLLLLPLPHNLGGALYYTNPKTYLPLAITLALVCVTFMIGFYLLLPLVIVFIISLLMMRVKRH